MKQYPSKFFKGRILPRMTRFISITKGRSLKTVQKPQTNYHAKGINFFERGHHWVSGVSWRKYGKVPGLGH